ncbi:MAG: adenylosuccinate lyase [Actinomycetota bacterium]
MTVPNVLADRYASAEMVEVWSAEGRIMAERRLWIAVLEAEAAAGLAIDPTAIDDYRRVVAQVDLASIRRREERTRHDVKARIEEFDDLAGHQLVHAGMTSRDVTENTEQLLVLRSMGLVRRRAVALLDRLAIRATTDAHIALAARTHNVPAQVTTLGKRWAVLGEELLLGIGRLDDLLASYPLRGLKGAVGTQQDLCDLVGPDAAARVEASVIEALGHERVLGAVGQVYPRSLDFAVVSTFVELASAPTNLARLVRLMAGQELLTEEFRPGQVGSSAMPHKMNPRSSERIQGLQAVLRGHLAMVTSLAGEQWNEGDVSCSVTRRVVLPDACLAVDGLLQTTLAVVGGVGVHQPVIDLELDRYLPFLATGRMLAAAVRAGIGREDAHELVKEHAVAAALDLRAGGEGGPELLRRLGDDERFPLDEAALAEAVSDVMALTGTVEAQIATFAARAATVVATDPDAADYEAEMSV